MTNKEIYKKTLCFSVRQLIIGLISLVLFAGFCVAGYFIAEKAADKGLIGLAIGLVVGLIVAALISRFLIYRQKAAQIAMMTKGITEGTLPDNVYQEGKKIVKERFATLAALFAITAAIKAIFNQIGRGISSLGQTLGGDTGGAVGSAVSSAIQTMVAYLCDCCLGWVFFRSGVSAVKATCEGAVLFFKKGKALIKNVGRIFGMGLASLALIGGAVFGLSYLIFSRFGNAFSTLASEIAEGAARLETEAPDFLTNPATLTIACAGLLGVVIWSFVHTYFIRPFVLTGVLRNFLEAGMADIPTEESFSLLDSKSPKFAKLRKQLTD